MKKVLFLFTMLSIFAACSSTETPIPDGEDPTDNPGKTYSPELKFTFKGTTYTANSTNNTSGESRIFVNGLDADGNLLVDMDLPIGKGKVVAGKMFHTEFKEDYGQFIFYINNDQWAIDGGTLTITQNENNRVGGVFFGNAKRLDYSVSPPKVMEESELSGGSFKDLEVK